MAGSHPQKYWASEDSESLMKSLVTRRSAFDDALISSGVAHQIHRNWSYYQGLFYDSIGGSIVFDTADAQALLGSNHFRSILRTLLNYTTSSAPQWDPQAANEDQQAVEATIIANQLLDYEVEASHFEEKAHLAAEYALVYKIAYLLTEWDTTLGEETGIQNAEAAQFTYAGDRRYSVLTPFQVMFDYTLPAWSDVTWVQWEEPKSKWDLAEVHYSQRDKIIALESEWQTKFWGLELGIVPSPIPSDSVMVHTFVHLPTRAMPKGRLLKYAGNNVLLSDEPLPKCYKRLPVHRIVHSETPGSILVGHSPADDMAPLQEALNSELSTILTNHAKFAHGVIWIKYGDPINEQQFQPNESILQSETEAKRLDMVGTSADLMAMVREIIAHMRAVPGVADASVGQVSRETAGIALALNDSSTIQNNRSFDFNYRSMIESAGQSIIEMYQALPPDDSRMISVVGENGRAQQVSFTAEQLQPVKRILVKLGPANLRTPAGRQAYMEYLRNIPGMISRPEQILEVLETGRMKSLTLAEDKQREAIRDAISKLRKGRPPGLAPDQPQIPIMVTDNLLLWAREIQAGILSDVNSRFNSAITLEAANTIGRCLDAFYANPVQQLILGWVTPQQLAAILPLIPQAAPVAPPGPRPAPAAPAAGQISPPTPQEEGIMPEAKAALDQGRQHLAATAAQSPLMGGK